jgi:DNA (cytosine-5)-methyltransferase 1
MDRGPAYYNEIDPFCAQWLRNLIGTGLIPPGEVDQRDIREVCADDIRDYRQCHFFAGIGGWARALRLASWGDDRRVWTGSCPCQPFSVAGKKRGYADERHLWPAWFRLVRECRPSILFGEQVAAAIAHGWLDEAAHDLETEGYAVAAFVLPACGIAKPHRRDRLYFVADTDRDLHLAAQRGRDGKTAAMAALDETIHRTARQSLGTGRPGGALGDADQPGSQGRQVQPECAGECVAGAAGLEWVACSDGKLRPVEPGIRLLADGVPARVGKLRAYGNAIVPELAAEFIRAMREVMEADYGSR